MRMFLAGEWRDKATSIDVVRNPVRELSITPKTTRARTGDVVRFESVASGQANARVSAVARWSVSGVGATIDGGLTPFIAWDVAKLLVAAGIFPFAWWLIGRRPDDR